MTKLSATLFTVITTVLFGVIGVGVVAAANPDQLPNGDEPQLGQIPVVTDWHQITLPLDSYTMNAQDRSTVLRAQYQQTKACMERFGFVLDVPPWDDTNATVLDLAQPSHYRLYGLLDEEHAAREGYHVSSSSVPAEYEYSGQEHSRDYYNVIAAKPGGGTYNGQAIPPGGCIAEARRVVAEGGMTFDSTLPETLSFESWDRSNNDSRVISAFAAWSACMSESGFTYRTPMDANNDPQWSNEAASKVEIAVATADVLCKKQTNLTGIRMAADSAYQRVSLQAHAQELSAIRAGQKRELDNAVRLLATG